MKLKITFLLLSFCFASISAQTVNIQGDPYSGNPYATIADAIAASNNASDIILITGVHTESLNVDKGITLQGTDPLTDIIQSANAPASDGSGTGVIAVGIGNFSVTIENLGIQNGNSPDNGGGINIDKVTGLTTLSNLIITNNYSASNGGAIGVAGSNVLITGCTINNNTSSLDGGAIIASPNNGAAIDNTVDIKQSLINGNAGRNGGAIYINGNNNFGNDFLIDVNIENSTISNNIATSAGGGNGGGAIFSAARPLTSNTAIGNITLQLVHATFYGNSHASLAKSGIQFGSAAATNFSAYNSIIVSTDDITTKALNFANSNTTDVVNCILGGLNATPTLVDDVNKNNQKGRTASFAGLDGILSDEGGDTEVLKILQGSAADDFCTAATGISMPTIDQRGFTRESASDAGAYEFGGTLSLSNRNANALVSLYPNPANTFVSVNGVEDLSRVEIFDVTGKKVLSIDQPINNRFSVESFKSGIYLIRLTDENNKASMVKKLIIQ